MSAGLWIIVALTCTAFLWWAFSKPQGVVEAPALSGRVRYVVDGDSLYMNGHKPQIRLWGVDAPEDGERGFQAATDYLFLIAQDQRITCQQIDRDQYGRTVARCFLPDGREINRLMIESGMAKEYRRFTRGFYSRG